MPLSIKTFFAIALVVGATLNSNAEEPKSSTKTGDPVKKAEESNSSSPKKSYDPTPVPGDYTGQLKSAKKVTPIGIRVVALVDGKFEARMYSGGLPDKGWDNQEPVLLKSVNKDNSGITFENWEYVAHFRDGRITMYSHGCQSTGDLSPVTAETVVEKAEVFPQAGDYVGEIVTQYQPVRTPVGFRVVALGDGKFEAHLYKGGLPGNGWDSKELKVFTSFGKSSTDVSFVNGKYQVDSVKGKIRIITCNGSETGELNRVAVTK